MPDKTTLLQAVQSTLQTNAAAVTLPCGRWYDIRPMLDPREQSTAAIDQVVEVLQHAEAHGLVLRHAQQRHLLRVAQA